MNFDGLVFSGKVLKNKAVKTAKDFVDVSTSHITKPVYSNGIYSGSDTKNYAVYNKFNIDAVIAAAVLRSNGYTVIDNTKVIPEDGETYIWLGIQHNTFNGIINSMKGKEHVYIQETYNTSVDSEYYSSRFDNVRSIFEQVCLKFDIEGGESLGHSLVKFNTNLLTKENLTFIYVNLVKANKVLNGDGVFTICQYTENDKSNFEEYVRNSKYKLNGGFGVQYVETNLGYVKTAITYLTEECHLALRMIRLAHTNYANIAVTANGCMIDTNLSDIRGLTIDSNLISSRMM